MQPMDASRDTGISECPYIGVPVRLKGKPAANSAKIIPELLSEYSCSDGKKKKNIEEVLWIKKRKKNSNKIFLL